MTLQELKIRLEATGIPVAFNHFDSETQPPFLVYSTPDESCLYADGIIVYRTVSVEAELYTRIKSPETERKVEAALQAAGLSYQKYQDWIDSEQVYQTVYEFELEGA